MTDAAPPEKGVTSGRTGEVRKNGRHALFGENIRNTAVFFIIFISCAKKEFMSVRCSQVINSLKISDHGQKYIYFFVIWQKSTLFGHPP